MIAKIFKNFFIITFVFLALFEISSLLSHLLPGFGKIAFFIIIIGTIITAIHKLEYGLYIILAELFIGGHGYLFSFETSGISLSIRMALFLIIFSIWLTKILINKKDSLIQSKKILFSNFYFLFSYLALFFIILIGAINGLIRNGFSNAFFDINGWLYFALLPIFLTVIKKNNFNIILQILVASTTWLSLKTIAILYLFSHGIVLLNDPYYRWIRLSGVGEITHIYEKIYRIFFQSHVYCLIGFFIVLFILMAEFKIKEWTKYLPYILYLFLTSSAVIISQSRSFWVGAIVAIFFLIIYAWWILNYRLKKTFFLIIFLGSILISNLIIAQLIIGSFDYNIIFSRFSNLESEPASTSRLNQLQPLISNISQKALFGYGFGKQITYQSNDPRIINSGSNGIYTTYAFEWGYLDIALKVGVVGLLIYLALIVQIFFKGLFNFQFSIFKPLQIGLIFGLVALCVTNIFSPYLNHPLGIGYIMLVSSILNEKCVNNVK